MLLGKTREICPLSSRHPFCKRVTGVLRNRPLITLVDPIGENKAGTISPTDVPVCVAIPPNACYKI